MSIILYSNGLTEEVKPIYDVYTENEIISLFESTHEIKSYRFIKTLNSWCLYSNNVDEDNYNRIGSMLLNKTIYSHCVMIHDSEINSSWNLTDNLHSDYNKFYHNLIEILNDIATKALDNIESNSKVDNSRLPHLISKGTTEDKRILFEFDPNEQSKDFYDNEEFDIFSKKTYDFLAKNVQESEPFTIYEDKKASIVIDNENVEKFLDIILESFKNQEDYESCNNINEMIKLWTNKKSTDS